MVVQGSFVETFDFGALRTIAKNFKELDITDESTQSMLMSYLKKAKPVLTDLNKATVEVRYSFARGAKSGRRFAEGGLSLQSMFWRVRQTIAKQFYSDYDMVNAHPTILLQYCAKKGLKCPMLEMYVRDREPLLKVLCDANGIDRDHAKKVVLAVMNGGRADFDLLEAKPDWLVQLKTDVTLVHMSMWSDPRHRETMRAVVKKKGEEYRNLHGCLCNRILCDIENNLLEAALKFAAHTGVSVEQAVLVFDGIMLPKDAVKPETLPAMSAFMEAQTGYRVDMIEKPMMGAYDLSALPSSDERELQVAKNDHHAGVLLADIARPRVRKCGPRLFVLTDDRVWTENAGEVDAVFLNLCGTSNIMKVDDRGHVREFSGWGASAHHIIKFARANLPNDATFVEKLWKASLGKVFFADGVYDFHRGAFREETDEDMTTLRLSRPFPKVRDDAKIAELRAKVFGTIFACDEDIDCFLSHIARAMAGRIEDKHWVVCMSARNSGKGVLCSLNESAWESYTTMVISESFLLSRGSGGDEAKKLSWLLACEFPRLIFTNEMKVDASDAKLCLDGNIIKGKMASGGDRLMARRNFRDEVHFRIQGRLFVWCNDLPPITPADALSTMHQFNFPHEFVAALSDDPADPRRHFQRLKDENIKKYCAQRDVCDAYTWMVLDAYRDHEVVPSAGVLEETAAFVDAAADEWSILKDVFEITERKDDTVTSAQAADVVKGLKLNVSAQKLKSVLTKLGAKPSTNVLCDGKRVRGYTGVVVTVDHDDGAHTSGARAHAFGTLSAPAFSSPPHPPP